MWLWESDKCHSCSRFTQPALFPKKKSVQPTPGDWKDLFRYPWNRPSSKEILPWPWGCRDCHKSSTGTQRSCLVCLCSQSWGQWKRSPGPWSHPGIPLLTYKHTVDNRGKRKPPHSVKEARRYYILITIFTIKDPQTLDGLETEKSGNHTQLPLEWSY